MEQEPEEQPAQADEDLVWCSTPDIPKVDGSFSTLAEPQDGQATDAVLPKISFSNLVRHFPHRYSKIGTSFASSTE